jgi:hypothetical protein
MLAHVVVFRWLLVHQALQFIVKTLGMRVHGEAVLVILPLTDALLESSGGYSLAEIS